MNINQDVFEIFHNIGLVYVKKMVLAQVGGSFIGQERVAH